jgi:tetratricopeptide (TPR) repeat protein
MSRVSAFKKITAITALAALLSSSALASDETAQKIAADAMEALKEKQFEQSMELYDKALAESEISDVVRGQVLSAKANALLELGWASRQEKPLNDAIATFNMALKLLTKENASLDWARAHAKLGDVYRSLGYGMYNKNEQKTGAQLYAKSISAFQRALTVLNKEENLEEWAVAQRALGQALTNSDTFLEVSGKQTNASSLSKAIAAFTAATEYYTKESAPSDWAGLQFQLGDIYTTLHQRQGGVWLPKAVDAHKRVLEVLTEDINPSVWAQVHYFIGNGLAELGAKNKDKQMLTESIAASRIALESDYFKQIFPEFYERNSNNIQVAEKLIKKYEAEN